MTCLGCNLIEEKPVTLRTGETVCNECPAWRTECEARHVLTMPLAERREYLDGVEKKRGREKANELREEVRAQFTKAAQEAGRMGENTAAGRAAPPAPPRLNEGPFSSVTEYRQPKPEVAGSTPAGGHHIRDTSLDAYHQHKSSGKLTAQQSKVLAALRGDMTRSELEAASGVKINAVCGRVAELIELGEIEECGKRACKVTGETVYALRVREAVAA